MRLYKGIKKRLYKKLAHFHGGWVKKEALRIKKGDLIHDCDGFNHHVKNIKFFKFLIDRATETCWNREMKDEHSGIKSLGTYKSQGSVKPRKKQRWFIQDVEAIKDDGNSFCGCNSFPEKPHTREEIEAYVLRWNDEKGEYSDSVEEQIQQASQMEGWEKFKKWVEVLKSGGHICDEDGILLEEFRTKHD
jgi:hypothetical protein